jgi:hypothetical protein
MLQRNKNSHLQSDPLTKRKKQTDLQNQIAVTVNGMIDIIDISDVYLKSDSNYAIHLVDGLQTLTSITLKGYEFSSNLQNS